MLNSKTLDYLEKLGSHYDELSRKLQDPAVLKNPPETKKIVSERREIEELAQAYREWRKVEAEKKKNEELFAEGDPEWKELVQEELQTLRDR